MISTTMSLAQAMVRESPDAVDIFRIRRVAPKRPSFDSIAQVEKALAAAPPGDPSVAGQARWLIDHIVERYHRTHLAEFPEAIRLARLVESVHEADADCPRGLADHLAFMADDLECHQRREEVALFPMLLKGGGPVADFPIRRMMAEHLDVQDQLTTLAAITRDFSAPEGACETWRQLCRACRKLHHELGDHMRLENDVLFPYFL
ncbi:MAG: hemerythrin domain-containing protein [Caulobacter sp.]|nr:hemerythrin domain-containing protein [Caulobacter sp.]